MRDSLKCPLEHLKGLKLLRQLEEELVLEIEPTFLGVTWLGSKMTPLMWNSPGASILYATSALPNHVWVSTRLVSGASRSLELQTPNMNTYAWRLAFQSSPSARSQMILLGSVLSNELCASTSHTS